MKSSYIAFAVPFFFLLIAVELAVARVKRLRVYRMGDAIGDLGCGMAQQTVLLFTTAATLAAYTWIHDHHRLLTWSEKDWRVWLIAFVGVDFLYYWWHRLSHEINLLWAAHVVHHQSEDYNLAVALRQAVLTSWTTQPFYIWLAFLGVPPVVFASMNAISTLYQFWIHTELVGKLGFLEELLNTPSHHRVHHAINPRYLDKNYGATLIVWDRLFGTFAREDEPCVYGIVKPLASYNPLWAQIQPLFALAALSRAAVRPLDKLRVWFASPAWMPEGMPAYPGVADGSYVKRPKYDPVATRPLQIYVVVQFGIAVAATAWLMFQQENVPMPLRAALACLVLLTLGTSAGLLEGKRWARPVEGVRLVLLAAAMFA